MKGKTLATILADIDRSTVYTPPTKHKQGAKSRPEVLQDFLAGAEKEVAPRTYKNSDGAYKAMLEMSKEAEELKLKNLSFSGPFPIGEKWTYIIGRS